jgi:hypothetical protein
VRLEKGTVMRLAPVLILMLAAAAATAGDTWDGLDASPGPRLKKGDHVIVHPADDGPPIEGRCARITAETLAVKTDEGGKVDVPIDAIDRLLVRRGRDNAVTRGMVRGALLGYGAVGLGVLMDKAIRLDDEGDTPTGVLVAGTLLGAAIGAVVGLRTPPAHYQEVPLQVTPAVASGPWRVSMTVRF